MNIKQIITDYVRRSLMTTHGDMLIRGATVPERLIAVVAGQVLKSGGVGAKPVWGKDRAELTTQGDMVVRGASIAERLVAVAVGQVLKSGGVGAKPAWSKPTIADLGIAMGTESITGPGITTVSGLAFAPLLAFFLGIDQIGTNVNFSVGFDMDSACRCIFIHDDGTATGDSTTDSFKIIRSPGNEISGHVTNFTGDGCDITSQETGASTCTLHYLLIG